MHVIDSLKYGGAQKLLITFAEQARLNGVDVTVICLCESDRRPLAPELESRGVRVVSFPAPHLFSLSRLIALVRFVRDGDFSVVQTHLTYANILGGLAGLLSGVPVVATLHSTAFDRGKAQFLRDQIELWLLRRSTRVLAVGRNVADIYAPLLYREVDIVPNAVARSVLLSTDKRKKLRAELTGDAARPILISVGRLSPDKCVADLLEAFALVHAKVPQTALLVVGDGNLRSELQKQANMLGLDGDVFWLGMREDVSRLLAASDIYVSSSKREGLPLALLEAMMAGLALVVTEVGEVPRVVADGAGLLVPPQQPEILASTVLELLGNPDRQRSLGAAARERAQSHYGAEMWFERLMQLYRSSSKKRRDSSVPV